MDRKGAVFIVILLVLTIAAFAGPRAWSDFVGNAAVDFYGRVVDPTGAGMPDVTIQAELVSEDLLQVRFAMINSQRSRQDMSVTTDEHGRFSFTGLRGTHLNIKSVSKSGWELEWFQVPLDFSYGGADVGPSNPDQPFVYKMTPKVEVDPRMEAEMRERNRQKYLRSREERRRRP